MKHLIAWLVALALVGQTYTLSIGWGVASTVLFALWLGLSYVEGRLLSRILKGGEGK